MISATTNGQTTSYTFNALNQLTGVSGPMARSRTCTIRSATRSPRPSTANDE